MALALNNLANCNFVTESGGLFETNYSGANLSGACVLAATLFNLPCFRGANAARACFFEADLSFSDFRGANVRGATFCDAILDGVDFRGPNVTARQLACAALVTCSTILPNGQPAVEFDADQVCCGAACCAPDQCTATPCRRSAQCER